LALYDPDVVLDTTRLQIVGGAGAVCHGHDGLRAFFREWHEAWENVDYDYDELIDAGDQVVSVATRRGRGRVSGADVELHTALLWTVRDAKVVRVIWFPTRAEALEAAARSESARASTNVEIVRRVYDKWTRGDMQAGVDLFDPEIVFESFMPDSSERIICHGPIEVEAFMREFLAQWRDYRLFGDEFREVGGDTVFVKGHQAGTGRQSGVAVEGPTYSIWTFQGGRVVHLVFEADLQRALEVAGLSE
jgi:ketosteroid isomerase-like protein